MRAARRKPSYWYTCSQLSSRRLPCGSLGHGEADLLLGGVLGGVERLGDDAWAGAVDAILAAVLRGILDVAVEHAAEEGDGDARDVVVELVRVRVRARARARVRARARARARARVTCCTSMFLAGKRT